MRSRFIISSPLAALLILASSAPGYDQISIPTTADAFYQPGTQPLPDRPGTDPVQPMDEFKNASFSCQQCHLFDDDDNPEIDTGPMNLWAASMMGQSTRDPVCRRLWPFRTGMQNSVGNTAFDAMRPLRGAAAEVQAEHSRNSSIPTTTTGSTATCATAWSIQLPTRRIPPRTI